MMCGKDKEMVVVATNKYGYCPFEQRKGDVEQSHATMEKEHGHVNLNGSKAFNNYNYPAFFSLHFSFYFSFSFNKLPCFR